MLPLDPKAKKSDKCDDAPTVAAQPAVPQQLSLRLNEERGAQEQRTVLQSPKTPTLSRKLKAISLDSEQQQMQRLQLNRNVFSVPNTPKKQQSKLKESNLKKYASNSSISGSQTLKTLPEIRVLQDFTDERPVEAAVVQHRSKPKGLLERRGSNASLTIDLGVASGERPVLNSAKSFSTLNLSAFDTQSSEYWSSNGKLASIKQTCKRCIIYESIASKFASGCNCSHRKSLSNENLYVPPVWSKTKGNRQAHYPRQGGLEASLSEDFKLHLQNVQYLQTAGNLIRKEHLKQRCDAKHIAELHKEFWEVPLNLQEKCLVSGSQTKNRYKGVLPNEHSRVHLTEEQLYIHANYIKGPDYAETLYVATQGPMLHTSQDFWQMVWQTNSTCIVMLTQLVEKGRNKCDLYFPLGKTAGDAPSKASFYTVRTARILDKFSFDPVRLSNAQQQQQKRSSAPPTEEIEVFRFEETNQVTFGEFTVTFAWKRAVGECQVRQLMVRRGAETRCVRHFWYPNWQDHKQADPHHVLALAEQVLAHIDAESGGGGSGGSGCQQQHQQQKQQQQANQQKRRGLVVCHCSAGIGRTGCFLAVLNGMQQLRQSGAVDVLAIVCSLRLHRGGMVQTAEQYVLIHRVLSLYADTLL